MLHPDFLHRQMEKIHSIIQSLCLSLLPLPFSIIFLLVTEFCSRQVTYGSRLSQEGTCSECIAQTMREFERGVARGDVEKITATRKRYFQKYNPNISVLFQQLPQKTLLKKEFLCCDLLCEK